MAVVKHVARLVAGPGNLSLTDMLNKTLCIIKRAGGEGNTVAIKERVMVLVRGLEPPTY